MYREEQHNSWWVLNNVAVDRVSLLLFFYIKGKTMLSAIACLWHFIKPGPQKMRAPKDGKMIFLSGFKSLPPTRLPEGVTCCCHLEYPSSCRWHTSQWGRRQRDANHMGLPAACPCSKECDLPFFQTLSLLLSLWKVRTRKGHLRKWPKKPFNGSILPEWWERGVIMGMSFC